MNSLYSAISKKVIYLHILAASLFIFPLQKLNAQAFEKGSQVAGLGLGFGWIYHAGTFSNTTSFPSLLLQYDYGIMPVEGIGIASVGGVLGYKHIVSEADSSDFRQRWSNVIFAVRGALHVDLLQIDELDTYGGVLLGIRSEAIETNIQSVDNGNIIKPVFGIYAGVRYNLLPNIGLFAEAGLSISYLTLGASFAF